MEERTFELLDVISATSGRLVSSKGIDAVYEVLNFMSGESVFTHQLPRIGREAQAAILEYHPWLSTVFKEAKGVTRDNWMGFASDWERRYGLSITVRRMTVDEHERIDPRSELAEKIHPDRVLEFKTR